MESVREWSPERVTHWMRGLDDALQPYVCSFLQQQVGGERLLSLSPQELLPLGVSKVGHQELVLEAVELLRALNAGVEAEQLKTLMGKMRNAEHGLSSAVMQRRKSPAYQHRHAHLPSNNFLTAVVELIAGAKSLLTWLDRASVTDSPDFKARIIHLCLELTSTVQKQNCTVYEMEEKILEVSRALNSVCEKTVQEISEPSLVEASCLEEVYITRDKPNEGLGIYIKSSYDGLHIITGTTENSPADKTKRIHAGDEVIQVNKQTVVGWQLKHLVNALRAESDGVALMVKKRPVAAKGGSASAPLRNLCWRPPLIQVSQSVLSTADVPLSRTKDAELESYVARSPATPDGGVLAPPQEVMTGPRSPPWRLHSDMWRRPAVTEGDGRFESLQPTAVRLRQRPVSVCKARPVSMPAESFSAVLDLSSRSGTHRRKGPPLHRCLSNERISTVTEEEPQRVQPTVHRVDHIRGSRCLVSADPHAGASRWETPPTNQAASGSAPPHSQGVAKQSLLGGWLARLRLLSQ